MKTLPFLIPKLLSPKIAYCIIYLAQAMLFICICKSTICQTVELSHKTRLAGSAADYSASIMPKADGYLLAGSTQSQDGHFGVGYSAAALDAFLSVRDTSLNAQWLKRYGSTAADAFNQAIATADGGYMAIGYTGGNDGMVHGNHGGNDIWVVRTNATGDTLWTRCYGSTATELGTSICELPGGDFILAGQTTGNNNGQIGATKGGQDMVLMRITGTGNLVWSKNFGGEAADNAARILLGPANRVLIAGNTQSAGGQVTGHQGGSDFWILSVDFDGNLIWSKTLGGTTADVCFGISYQDNDLVVSGQTNSALAAGLAAQGANDYLLVRLNPADGTQQGALRLGGAGEDRGAEVTHLPDGTLALLGFSNSTTANALIANKGDYDLWLIKLDANLQVQWTLNVGGSAEERNGGLCQGANHTIALAGFSTSANADLDGNSGSYDAAAFVVSSQNCQPAETPVLVLATAPPYCAGSFVQIQIQHASLQGSAHWVLRQGNNCTGQEVEMSTTNDIWYQLPANGNETLSVRGEGGCATQPGPCATINIPASTPFDCGNEYVFVHSGKYTNPANWQAGKYPGKLVFTGMVRIGNGSAPVICILDTVVDLISNTRLVISPYATLQIDSTPVSHLTLLNNDESSMDTAIAGLRIETLGKLVSKGKLSFIGKPCINYGSLQLLGHKTQWLASKPFEGWSNLYNYGFMETSDSLHFQGSVIHNYGHLITHGAVVVNGHGSSIGGWNNYNLWINRGSITAGGGAFTYFSEGTTLNFGLLQGGSVVNHQHDFINYGNIMVPADAFSLITLRGNIINHGQFRKAGSEGQIEISGQLVNNGLFEVKDSTSNTGTQEIVVSGTLINNGQVSIKRKYLEVSGSIQNHNLMELGGVSRFLPGSVIINQGNMYVRLFALFTGPHQFNGALLNKGALDVVGPLEVGNQFINVGTFTQQDNP